MTVNTFSDVADIANEVARGAVSAVRMAEQAIAAHRASDDSFGAYKTWAGEYALRMAAAVDMACAAGAPAGRLAGVPVSVKDLYGVHDLPVFAGTPRELPGSWRAEGPVVAAARRAGAVFTGKTHTVELAFGGLGVNPHWATPRNPWDGVTHRVPGGSSAGAGVSLQAGSASIALGTDTAGSVRIPASMTGVVGLKTSAGRWALDGIVPLSPTLDTAGILARSVADAITAFEAIDPLMAADPARRIHEQASLYGLRIGRAGGATLWGDCSAGIVESLDEALNVLQAEGARITDVDMPEAGDAIDLLACGNVVSAQCDLFLEDVLVGWREHIDPIIASRIADGGAITAREYLRRERLLVDLAHRADGYFRDYDLLVAPTVAHTPPAVQDVADLKDYRRENMAALRNTCVASNLSLCALTLPIGLDAAGMPVGMQLMARAGGEERLLGWAAGIERVLGRASERLGAPPMRG